jgi:DNA helicase II / ATP-dependent DNA helicase PcrA
MLDFSKIGPKKIGPPADRLAIGQQVSHAHFGEGVVTGVEPGGIVIILFSDTERKLVAEYAPLTVRD